MNNQSKRPLLATVVALAWPAMLEQALQTCVQYADSAMDALLLPSLFEGFPTVALESQCAGLPTILSEAVTRDCALTDFAAFEPLDAERWAARIREGLGQNRAQQSAEGRSAVVQAGHDLTHLAASLQTEYLRLVQADRPQA